MIEAMTVRRTGRGPGGIRAMTTWWPAFGGLLEVLLLVLVAGCAHQGGNPYSEQGPSYAPTHYYPPPGPRGDPWGPYIVEAAARFSIPAQWIRAVMHQESGGEEQAVSPVGAIGLMQIMPQTYQDLQSQYGLGEDPFDPQNNILAGAGYIKQMYDRYGAPGFLAAYNAGPENVDSYLAGTSTLPDETVNYLAMITPNLGNDVAFSGPFASYGSGVGTGQSAPTPVDFASGCDMNAAYDPNHPCRPGVQRASIQGQPVIVASASAGSCDANAAYDPNAPCTATAQGTAGSCDADRAFDSASPCAPQTQAAAPVPTPPAPDCSAETAFNPACPASVIASVQSAPHVSGVSPAGYQATGSGRALRSENWGIQVGAFANANLAQTVAQNAANELSGVLENAAISFSTTAPFGGNVLYQARLTHLSRQTAVNACSVLNRRQLPCVVVAPSKA